MATLAHTGLLEQLQPLKNTSRSKLLSPEVGMPRAEISLTKGIEMQKFSRQYSTILILGIMLCATTATAQVAPPLGQAGSFAALAGSAVTNTGATVVTGDLGVSPGSAVTGFPPGTVVSGTIHANDATAAGAQADLTTAYNSLAGQACNTDLTGTDLGGLTLTPGVYCFSTSAQLTGTLTLDAQANVNSIFVFQIGSTLTTASAANVVVINGGTDCNVFWQAGSSATLGTATTFVGNILASTSITLTTGVTSHGSLWARNGALTTDTNQVAVCAPTTPVSLQSYSVD